MKLSKYPKKINEKVLEKLSKEYQIESDVIKTILATYCTKIGVHDGAAYSVFYPQYFLNLSGVEVDTYEEADKIDSRQAMFSTAYGIGGVVGLYYSQAGYTDVTTMKILFDDSEVEQLVGLLNLIKSRKRLYKALQEKNWAHVSNNYNGIGYSNINAAKELFNNYKSITS